MYTNELYHHGVKGQKWGVRRYQYAAGRKRLKTDTSSASAKLSEFVKSKKTIITGRQYVDGYLNKGTTLARIQMSENFEKFAFYATYKKSDMDKYMGLFGKIFLQDLSMMQMQLRKRLNRLVAKKIFSMLKMLENTQIISKFIRLSSPQQRNLRFRQTITQQILQLNCLKSRSLNLMW